MMEKRAEQLMEPMMRRTELDQTSTDELWSLHVEVSDLLQQRIDLLFNGLAEVLLHSIHLGPVL